MEKSQNRQKIGVVEIISTGFNYIDDILSLGYEPLVIEGHYIGKEDEIKPFKDAQMTMSKKAKDRGITVIPDTEDYNEMLAKVKEYNPIIIVAGSEFGVPLATRLADDLGLPGNSAKNIKAMTEKAAMHDALKNYGIRYIKGRLVTSIDDASSYYDELGTENVVVKRTRGAGTQGVFLCQGKEEAMNAVRSLLNDTVKNGDEDVGILMQQRIIGTEYIVNTVSCNGKHRLASIWRYEKMRLPNGTNAYINSETLNKLDAGLTRLIRYAYDVADAIGIKYGPIHGEYMIDENGPVLIEVNCRPMGAGLPRKYTEQIFGHHETDIALDAYLNPHKFEIDKNKLYRPLRKGILKLFAITQDTNVESAPILPICNRLKSMYKGVFDRIGREDIFLMTSNLETVGGVIYLVHDDERVVESDNDLLHLIEMKYPKLLFQNTDNQKQPNADRNIEKIIRSVKDYGRTLVVTDTNVTADGVTIIGLDELKNAYDSFEQGILDLSKEESFADLESIFQQIYQFSDKIRQGGRIIIPESTYQHIPYGCDGMEILLIVAGFRIEVPLAEAGNIIVASK